MQQYLTYLCTDINENGPSIVIFLRFDQFYVLRFYFVGYMFDVICFCHNPVCLEVQIKESSFVRYPAGHFYNQL